METMKWYTQVTGDDSVNAVATRANLIQTTLSRQIKRESLTAETVIAIARAYSVDVIGALVSAGFLTEADVRDHGVASALESALDIEIAREVSRRLGSGDSSLDAPLG